MKNARMATLIVAINNFANVCTSQDCVEIDPKVINLEEKKEKVFQNLQQQLRVSKSSNYFSLNNF